MARPGSEHPTDLELEILKILWDDSPLLVRDVRARLEADADRPLAHSSVITMLNIMYRKGFLRRRKKATTSGWTPEAIPSTATVRRCRPGSTYCWPPST